MTATLPGPPGHVAATAGDASATVTFTAPADTGGDPVTGYTVTATDYTNATRGHQTATGTASPITIATLSNGDQYGFTVTAANTIGTGPASPESNAVEPMAAGTAVTSTTTTTTTAPTTTLPRSATTTPSPLPLTGESTAFPLAAAAGLLVVALSTRRLRRLVHR